MTAHKDFDSLLAAARAELDDAQRNKVMYGVEGAAPRLELFHAGLSICSQKVRTVLAEKGDPYLSHEMVILATKGIYAEKFTPAENYRPGYVRLRSHIARQQGLMGNLAEWHTYRSSVQSEGFDACVVPLLIDNEKRCGVVDSAEIIKYIDREITGKIQLIPDDPGRAEAVLRQVSIVDSIPHPGMLYAFFENDPRPDFIKHAMADVYDMKVGALNQLIDQNRDDEELVRAYQAKISKELAGKKIQHDRSVTASLQKEFQDLIAGLDAQLAAHGDPWVCGSEFTLADAVWAVSLYRIHWLGHAYLWADYPRVKEYAYRVYKRPSVWENVVNWPSPMPASPHTADVFGKAA